MVDAIIAPVGLCIFLDVALDATGAFRAVRAQTVVWRVTTSLARLVEQATHYHYSTFRLYSEDAHRAAIDTFRQRVRQAFPDVTHITHDCRAVHG